MGEIDAMPRREVAAWMTFYEMFPFDDFHRYHRPAALVAGSMGGGEISARLSWLQPDPTHAGWAESDLATFAALGVKPPMKD